MTSVVAICNRALDMLGAEPVTSLADNTKAARLCARNFEPMLHDVIATRLAADLSYSLTASAALGQSLMEIYQTKLAEARAADAQEGSADDVVASWAHVGVRL